MSTPELSVVIPFKNAAPFIRDQLEALVSQDLERPWEIVAVDDGSRDASRRIIAGFSEQLPIRTLGVDDGSGSARARNVGARSALGTKLLFIDADDEVAPGYLAAMAAALDRHEFVTSSFDSLSLNPDWVHGAHGPAWRDPDDPIPRMFGFLPFTGGSIGVTRRAFDAAGGFPEHYLYAVDIGFSWQAQLAGVELHHVPDAVYRVRYKTTLRGLHRQARRWGTALPLVFRHYRHLGMQRRSLGATATLWLRQPVLVARARSKADLAPIAVQSGLLIGRVLGSIRHRVLYL